MTTDGDGGLDESLSDTGLSSDELVNTVTSEDAPAAAVATTVVDAEQPDSGRVVEELISHLEADASLDEQESIAAVLTEIAVRDREHSSRVVEAFAARMDDPRTETTVMNGLGRLAERRPAAVDPVLERVADRLTGEPLPVRRIAAEIISGRADDDPSALVDVVPALAGGVSSTAGVEAHSGGVPRFEQQRFQNEAMAEERLRQRLGAVLERVAAHEPGAVAAELETLGSVVEQRGRNLHTRQRVVAAMQSVAASSPAAAGEAIQPLVAVVESDEEPASLRAAAANTLAVLADEQFERVTEASRAAIPTLGDLLTADEVSARAAAAGLLSYLAQRYAEDVTALTASLVDCLDCEERTVRASAVWTLSYLETETARDALDDVATADPDPEVRSLAAELL